MKKVFAIILLFIFSFQAFYSSALTVWFYANQSKITELFCVNKAKPEMKCNGKCFLSKKLKEADSNTKDQPSSLKQIVEISLCIVANFNYSFKVEVNKLSVNPYYFNAYSFRHENRIFHPPLFI